MTQLSPHFWRREFIIDGQHQYYGYVPVELLIALEFYREQLKAQFYVKFPEGTFNGLILTSYARTHSYNVTVGGDPDSHHIYNSLTGNVPNAIDFTTEGFDMYNHSMALHLTREHMKSYNIYISSGLYLTKRFIHFNTEKTYEQITNWTKK